MKKKLFSLALSLVLLCCAIPTQAFAASVNEGSSTASMEVSYTIGANYIIEIPSSINLNNSTEFRITATTMNIGENQTVAVSIDGNSSYESDGNFYLHDASNRIPCEIVVGATPITGIDYDVARFEHGSLTNGVLDAICFTPGSGLPGTYTGTLYFKITLT